MIKLDVLTDEISGEICANRCGSKCCDFKLSDHFVPVEIVDYANLGRIGATKFVSFYSSLEAPQLIHRLNGKCIFLKEETGLCSIYEFRPLACRNYPFRESKDEEAELPPWCELYHRASKKLELQRIEKAEKLHKQYYDHQRNTDPDLLMEYLEFDRSNKIFQLDIFPSDHRETSSQIFLEINAVNNDILKLAQARFDKVISNFEHDWFVANILVYDDHFEIKAKIEAVYRSSENIAIPFLEEFPPKFEDYDRLYRIVMATDDYKNNSITGALLPDNFIELVEMKVRENIPVNSEFQ